MSLNEVTVSEIVQKQFRYKLKAYVGVFTSLVLLQLLAIIFSLGGNGGGSYYSEDVSVHYNLYTIYNVIAFTTLWALIHAILMTKNDPQNTFSFVDNNLTKDVSNIIFLSFASVIAAVLTILSAFFLRVIIYFFFEIDLLEHTFVLTGAEVLSGIFVMTFHFLLFCAIGYLLGTLSRMHPLLPVLLPVTIIGGMIGLAQMGSDLLMDIITFYYQESNLFLFFIKMLISIAVLFGISIFLSGRTEVRK